MKVRHDSKRGRSAFLMLPVLYLLLLGPLAGCTDKARLAESCGTIWNDAWRKAKQGDSAALERLSSEFLIGLLDPPGPDPRSGRSAKKQSHALVLAIYAADRGAKMNLDIIVREFAAQPDPIYIDVISGRITYKRLSGSGKSRELLRLCRNGDTQRCVAAVKRSDLIPSPDRYASAIDRELQTKPVSCFRPYT